MQLAIFVLITLCAIAVFGIQWDIDETPDTEKNSKSENWRWALRKRRIQRWFIYKVWQQYVPNLRWLGLLFVAVLTFFVVRKYLPDFNVNKIAKLEHTADATLLLALIGAPIAYVIWWFRDANARLQIENQRKDVNLKDFQRLAEWAAGMHLPENKITSSEKEIKSESKQAKKEQSTSTETFTSTESSEIQADTVIHTPSRREGAASLQIAAIYQLQAFLQGDYGKYFQRPAFQLLKSIWLALVSQHLAALNTLMQQKRDFAIQAEKAQFDKDMQSWKDALADTMHSPIGQAITVALGAQQGWLLRTHQADLPNAILTGYNSSLAALSQPLELDGLNLSGIQLQGADLTEAQLQGADLIGADLQSANLTGAKLQGARLGWTQLQGASLRDAQLQGAHLFEAQLEGADLFEAQLQGADLRLAQMQGAELNFTLLQNAILIQAELQSANLFGAELQGADLSNISIDATTQLKHCIVDTDTKILVTGFDENFGSVIDFTLTFALRTQLRQQGLDLPSWFDTQLHFKATQYSFVNSKGETETRHDVGLLSSF